MRSALATALGIRVALAAAGAAQESSAPPPAEAVVFGLENDVRSRYVFRGIAYSPGAVNQYTAWLQLGDATVYAWGNVLLEPDPTQRHLSELDFGVSWALSGAGLAIEPALDGYLYRMTSPFAALPTVEGSLRLARELGPLTGYTKQVVDLGSFAGAYYGEAGVDAELALHERAHLEGTLRLAWASPEYNDAYLGASKAAVHYAAAEISLSLDVSPRFRLRPHFELTRIVDSELRARSGSPDLYGFGVALELALN